MTENTDKDITKEDPLLPLKKRWIDGLNIAGDPSVILTILATLGLMILKSSLPPNTNLPPAIDLALNFIISIFAGTAGALISNRWSKLNETSILTTRGKSAIRGLTLLGRNIAAMDRRLKQYSDQLTPQNENSASHYQLFRFTYEELSAKCIALQEETINAIEEWQDIVPEAADPKTQIGVITQIAEEKSLVTMEVEHLREKIINDSNVGDEQMKNLTSQLAKKEEELHKVTTELNKQLNSQSNLLRGFTVATQFDPSKDFIPAAKILQRINADTAVLQTVLSGSSRTTKKIEPE